MFSQPRDKGRLIMQIAVYAELYGILELLLVLLLLALLLDL